MRTVNMLYIDAQVREWVEEILMHYVYKLYLLQIGPLTLLSTSFSNRLIYTYDSITASLASTLPGLGSSGCVSLA